MSKQELVKHIHSKNDGCEITQPSTSLCYPRNDTQQNKFAERLFKYRQERNDDKCLPSPKDPCVITTDFISPTASLEVNYVATTLKPIGNIPVKLYCSKTTYESEQEINDSNGVYSNWMFVSGSNSADYPLKKDRTSTLFTSSWYGKEDFFLVEANTYIEYISVNATEEEMEATQRNVNESAFLLAHSAITCTIANSKFTSTCPNSVDDPVIGDASSVTIDDGTITATYSNLAKFEPVDPDKLTEFTQNTYPSLLRSPYKTPFNKEDYVPTYSYDYKGYISKPNVTWPKIVGEQIIGRRLLEEASSRLSCVYGNHKKELFCVYPLVKYDTLKEDNTIQTDYAIKNMFSTEGTGVVLSSDLLEDGDSVYKNIKAPVFIKNANKVLVPKDATIVENLKAKEENYTQTLDTTVADTIVVDVSINGFDIIITRRAKTIKTKTTDSGGNEIEKDTGHVFIEAQQYTEQLSYDNFYEDTSKFSQLNILAENFYLSNDVKTLVDTLDNRAQTLLKNSLICTYTNEFYKDNCSTGLELPENQCDCDCDETEDCCEDNVKPDACVLEGTINSQESIWEATNQAKSIVDSMLTGCLAQNAEVKAFCDYTTMINQIEIDQQFEDTVDENGNVIESKETKKQAYINNYVFSKTDVVNNFEAKVASKITSSKFTLYTYINHFDASLTIYNGDKPLSPGNSSNTNSDYCSTTGTIPTCYSITDLNSTTVNTGSFISFTSDKTITELNKQALELALNSIVCFYTNLAVEGATCTECTSKTCTGSTANDGSCAVAIDGSAQIAGTFLADDPEAANIQAQAAALIGKVCIQCDKVGGGGGGGGSSVNVNYSGSSCSNCGTCSVFMN